MTERLHDVKQKRCNLCFHRASCLMVNMDMQVVTFSVMYFRSNMKSHGSIQQGSLLQGWGIRKDEHSMLNKSFRAGRTVFQAEGIELCIDPELRKDVVFWKHKRLHPAEALLCQEIVERECSMCVLSLFTRVQLFATPWTVALQAPLSVEFCRQEYWSGLPGPPPGDRPNPGIKPRSPTLQSYSFTL